MITSISSHSLEANDRLFLETRAAPGIQLTAEEVQEYKIREQDQIVYTALQQLSPRYRDTLISCYGLYGEPTKRIGDIAEELHIAKKAVDHILRRAKNKLLAHITEQVSQHG